MRAFRLFLMMVLLLPAFRAAAAEVWGYRVNGQPKTLIQIARDVYQDERLWKEIAYWNALRAPYSLSDGMILVLHKAPVRAIEERHRAAESDLPAQHPGARPSVAREMHEDGGVFIYTVNERAPSLAMVARDVYGDVHRLRDLQVQNGLPKGARLQLGQKLRVHGAVLSEAEGTRLLIEQWRVLGNTEMVARLGGEEAGPAPATAPAPVSAPVSASDSVDHPQQPAVQKAHPVVKKAARPVPAPQPQVAVPVAPVSPAPSVASPAISAPRKPASATPPTSAPATVTQEEDPAFPEHAGRSLSSIPEIANSKEPKADNYWLGESANQLIESISQKLQFLETSRQPAPPAKK